MRYDVVLLRISVFARLFGYKYLYNTQLLHVEN